MEGGEFFDAASYAWSVGACGMACALCQLLVHMALAHCLAKAVTRVECSHGGGCHCAQRASAACNANMPVGSMGRGPRCRIVGGRRVPFMRRTRYVSARRGCCDHDHSQSEWKERPRREGRSDGRAVFLLTAQRRRWRRGGTDGPTACGHHGPRSIGTSGLTQTNGDGPNGRRSM